MPQGNMFRSSSRAQMGSMAIVNQSQGGGSKKAGFPHQIGREMWTTVAFNSCNPVHGHCCKLSSYQFTMNPNVRQSRSIGISPSPNAYLYH